MPFRVSDWSGFALSLDGPGFALFQRALAEFNAARLNPTLAGAHWRDDVRDEFEVLRAEAEYVEAVRAEIAPLVGAVPCSARALVDWFEDLKETGPGQGDPLFPWLAEEATLAELTWFIEQEVAGEAGFEDLLSLTQVKMPEQAKLEMARNYWDEMGRGQAKGMHGPMLRRLAEHLDVHPTPGTVVPESLALGNMMIALAGSRRYAFHSIGALGVIELTAPGRSAYVDQGLKRLGVPTKARHYFTLHAVLDVKHSQAWNREVLFSLVAEDPRRAQAIGEGAVMRLWHGARCFGRYRAQFATAAVSNAVAA